MSNSSSECVTLGDLCDLVAVQVDPGVMPDALYVGLEHLVPGRLRRKGGGRAADVRSSKFAFRQGDVLYGKLRPYLDKSILADRDGVCTTELLVLRPKPDVDPRFLACVVHSAQFIEHALAGITGAHHPRTSWSHIAAFAMPRFTRSEQAAILAYLWPITKLLDAGGRSLETGEELKSAAMRELFTRGLRGEPQKETEIGPVPESWEVLPLGNLGQIGNGSTPRRTVPEYWGGGEFPWLTSAKVYDRIVREADEHITQVALEECHLPVLAPGAVLIAITGQGKTLGHCAVLGIHATINQLLAYLQPDLVRADPRFLAGYLETLYPYLRQVATGGGSTKDALTCAFLRQLLVPLPTLADQKAIVTILDAIDRKITLHRRKRALLDELFKSLLHKLMTGEIRVADLDLSALPASAEAVG